MARIYVALIRKNIKTLEDVPAHLKDAVKQILDQENEEHSA